MRSLLGFAYKDLRGSGRTLWVFALCLILGVALIAASAGLYRLVQQGLSAQTRVLLGGDLELYSGQPLSAPELDWIKQRSQVSLLTQFRTMLVTSGGQAQLVLLQGVDDRYPLYGTVELDPAIRLDQAIATPQAGSEVFPIVIDRQLGERLALAAGDEVGLGSAKFRVSAFIDHQPDRSLRAEWNGLPVLVSSQALQATGLLQAGSRASYRYRVSTDQDVQLWRDAFFSAFPDGKAEIRTFEDRNARLGEVLGQIGSGVLLIGFSALLIGALGIYNSVWAYLGSKLRTLATLGAIGLRDRSLMLVYSAQMLMLAGVCAAIGSLLGAALAVAAGQIVMRELPMSMDWGSLLAPAALAWVLGVAAAMTFTWPALGRALTVSPADLFRSTTSTLKVPWQTWLVTSLLMLCTIGLLLGLLPDPFFGVLYLVAVVVIFVLLELIVRGIRFLARRLASSRILDGRFVLRLAVSSLHRPDSPLRAVMLSLGCALTLMVTTSVVVSALFVTIDQTVPERAPSLVFYDVPATQKDVFEGALGRDSAVSQTDLMPFVLGRVSAVNGHDLSDSADSVRQREARDEHKLSYWHEGFDEIVVTEGRLWEPSYRGEPLVAMEDREALQLGLRIGDLVEFEILGQTLQARLVAIYAQKRLQSRLWLEAVFSEGALDPFITRYVGMSFVDPASVSRVQNQVARDFPAVVTVRTDALLKEARSILQQSGMALAVIGVVTLVASLLVLVSVMSAIRSRQTYVMTVLHTVGARVGVLQQALVLEYLLLSVVMVLFSATAGTALAGIVLQLRMGSLEPVSFWPGLAVAVLLCLPILAVGVVYLRRQFRLSTASLLRTSAG